MIIKSEVCEHVFSFLFGAANLSPGCSVSLKTDAYNDAYEQTQV